MDHIQNWTSEQKMKINEKKTKLMIFNETYNYQFSTRIYIKDILLDIIQETKLLGIVLTSNLDWKENTSMIIKKSYSRMEILRKLFKFNVPIADLLTIYIIYIRSYLEQSCVVWHASLSEENSNSLERVQKIALRIMLKEGYISYQNALEKTELKLLSSRREDLCLEFAKSCTQNEKAKSMFPLNDITEIQLDVEKNTKLYQVHIKDCKT